MYSGLTKPPTVADEEADYMDMAPKAYSRGSDHKMYQPQLPSQNSIERSPYKGVKFEESDYTDMRGKHNINTTGPTQASKRLQNARLQRNRSFASATSIGSSLNTKQNQLHSSSKSTNDLLHSRSNSRGISRNQSSPIDLSSNEQELRQPGNRSIRQGTFNKDDDDDYDIIRDINHGVADLSISGQRPQHIYEGNTPRSPPRRAGTVTEQRNSPFSNLPETPTRSRSSGLPTRQGDLTSVSFRSPPSPDNPGATAAGKAARKYLQLQGGAERDINRVEIKRTMSGGVVRPTTPSGRGVQSRINKTRQHQSLKQGRIGRVDDASQPQVKNSFSNSSRSESITEVQDVIDMEQFAREQKERDSKQARRGSSDSIEFPDGDTFDRSNSFQKAFNKSSDGSEMMRFIAEGKKSRSLDPSYVDWLVKTSPYASRTPTKSLSASNKTPKHHSTSDATESSTFDKLSGGEKDEEDFTQYLNKVKANNQQQQQGKEKKKSLWIFGKKDKTKTAHAVKESDATSSPPDRSSSSSLSKKSRKSWKNKSKKNKSEEMNSISAAIGSMPLPIPRPTEPIATDLNDQTIFECSQSNSNNKVITKPPMSSGDPSKRKGSVTSNSSVSHLSFSSPKKTHRHTKSATLERSPAVAELIAQSKHQRINSDSSEHISIPNGDFFHDGSQNKAHAVSSLVSSSGSVVQNTMLDISLTSNYDEDADDYSLANKNKPLSTKSNTLGRIFGRRSKERRSLEVVKNRNSYIGDLLFHKANNENDEKLLFDSMRSFSDDLILATLSKPPLKSEARLYMNKSLLVHGFAFAPTDADSLRDREDLSNLFGRKRNLMQKYATLSVFQKSSPKLQKASGENKTDQVNHNSGAWKKRSLKKSKKTLREDLLANGRVQNTGIYHVLVFAYVMYYFFGTHQTWKNFCLLL